jgi:hypothetical protein
MTCQHSNTETINEWEEFYSNGMFGIPASNLPLQTDIVNSKTTCTDCGARLIADQWFPNETFPTSLGRK